MKDTKTLFDGRAKVYSAGRCGYANELIDYLYQTYRISDRSVIADIGSGTGKLSNQLLDRGSTVYGIEPNADMRRLAEKELNRYPNFCSLNGNAEHTALSDHSVDFVTAAQAFHWFDTERFRKESARIMKSGGTVFLIWNKSENDEPIMQALSSVFTEFCPDFKGFLNGLRQDEKKIADFFENRYEYAAFDHPILYDREKFLLRYLSSSYSLRETDVRYVSFREALLSVFERYEKGGILTVPNQSVVYGGTI